ncbi:hypothetical protein L6164_028602 [Bauhinia variegata]|uniref:Uncharacterized protein n=1 Tax=Bauhinia variegata TaxID=167791 RepID=A0ACB9L720_BAUVA|nr:hypothetical protein L6164_028602 [Bauhinia variegata]
MPAMNNILSKWVPVAERSRLLALVYSGMYLGSVTGLVAFSPVLIHQFGWPSVFYSFGSLGTVWFAVWLNKIMQNVGFLGPAFFLTQLSHVNSPAMAILCTTCKLMHSQSELYSNHQDIAPRYSGILLGVSNIAGVLAGVLGTAATGSWDDIFKVSVGLYLVGTLLWNLFSTDEKILE